MVKSNQKHFVDYYVLLGFQPEDLEAILDPEEAERYVEKAYKETARRIHPDKVKVAGLPEAEATAKKEEATANFQELQKAYEIMKNPWMRAEYDKTRKKNSTPESFKPGLVPSEGLRFSGYSDEGKGFFKVYGDVFENIYANEVAFQEMKELPKDSEKVVKRLKPPPEIGDEHSPYAAVVQFYNFWLNFTTVMDFTWMEPHDDLSEAPTKKGAAVMQRKNVKARKKGRNEYNNKVRRLAQYPEWTKPVERKRKYGVEEKEEEEREEWECVVCRKEFKSEKQCLNHQMSKKHREMVAMLMGLKNKDLVQDVLELMEEEDELDDDHVDELLEGEAEEESEEEVCECVDENLEQKGGEEVDNDEVEEAEEEEEEENEMDVLEAMVARRKTNVRVGEPIFEPMATIIDVEEDEVEHEETKKRDESAEKKPRRRRSVKSGGINEHDDKKKSKPDSGEESCVDNGSEDEQKRKKGGKKEKRSKKNSKSNGESEIAGVKSSKSGSRGPYAGKMSRCHRQKTT
ncbi:PREDICTED: ABC transporter F family member 4-like [Fragaria vesca subsp. vesca]|uniref:ABC transporter F family member 4-like n=1 Tax=Fragaria vesca subsp. vesca TaxID=101020 RepID=UPI0002C345E9|nr:PREDICTED: ABC transporter F family member 4-like [Fragaria vesca subsp. vesca]